MAWDDWKSLGKKIVSLGAPILGTAIGGPAGPVLGALVGGLFGADPNDPAAIAEAIKADPQAMVKLQELQLKHKERLEEIALDRAKVEVEETKLYLADRQSAREREQSNVRVTGKTDINLYVLAYMFVGGFFVSIIVMLFLIVGGNVPKEIPQAAVMLLGMLFGALTAGVGAIIQYFFGSSKGSSDKTQIMAAGMQQLKVPLPAADFAPM